MASGNTQTMDERWKHSSERDDTKDEELARMLQVYYIHGI